MPEALRSESGIVSVSTSDTGGGAEQFARLMHETSQRSGIESRLLVGDRKTSDPSIIPLWGSPHFDYRPFQQPIRNRLREVRRNLQRKAGVEDFLHPYSYFAGPISGINPAILHLHNLHGGYFDLRALPSLSSKHPVVWTLHDYWALSGHCAYPLQCERWKTGCGNCPDLNRSPAIEKDATRQNFARKKSIFARSRLHIAAASRALLDRIPGSILEPAVIDSRQIPYGIDLDIFEPGNPRDARNRLNLPVEVPIILFAAYNAAENPYKDFDTVIQAIRLVHEKQPDCAVELVVLGSDPVKEPLDFPVHLVPFTDSRSTIADYFRAADLYLHAANDEVFGIVLLEAMACGTPVIATAVGGIPEVFDHEIEGLLVPPKDPGAMADATIRLLNSPAEREGFGRNAIERVRANNDIRQIHGDYLSWFREIIESRE